MASMIQCVCCVVHCSLPLRTLEEVMERTHAPLEVHVRAHAPLEEPARVFEEVAEPVAPMARAFALPEDPVLEEVAEPVAPTVRILEMVEKPDERRTTTSKIRGPQTSKRGTNRPGQPQLEPDRNRYELHAHAHTHTYMDQMDDIIVGKREDTHTFTNTRAYKQDKLTT